MRLQQVMRPVLVAAMIAAITSFVLFLATAALAADAVGTYRLQVASLTFFVVKHVFVAGQSHVSATPGPGTIAVWCLLLGYGAALGFRRSARAEATAN
jgi:hypothetical protein